ncbi:MAG: glycoside hydrolase family 16 protein, partial [Prevotellamassilia sp.]|nr:glycoside hydrolase family 16 protein [Prevotellamassilia sp.]
VEGRLLTLPHTGNFPAFWMMPQDNSKGWPYAGEIDIWEQIDAQNTSFHTIHSGWANGAGDGGLGNSNNPTKGGTKSGVTNGYYHTFGLEWEEDLLSWYVDGEKVFSYAKLKNNADALSKGQWPFDAPFYIILNQSVGNGSWAANADTNFAYETLFDWVRVYQKEGQIHQTGIGTVSKKLRLDFFAAPGRLTIVVPRRHSGATPRRCRSPRTQPTSPRQQNDSPSRRSLCPQRSEGPRAVMHASAPEVCGLKEFYTAHLS